MNCKIYYTLYTDNNKEIDKEAEAIYLPGKSLEFEENKIDLIKKQYIRKTDEYELVIDFITKTCELKYDKHNSLKFNIESFIKIKDDQIYLEYAFDEEIKKINIYLKEVVL